MTSALYAIRSALAAMRAAPFTHLVAAFSVAVALLLSTVAAVTAIQARSLLEAWSARGELTVYLDPGLSPEAGARLATRIEAMSGGSATYVSSDAALHRLSEALGEPGTALLDLPKNPLPASIEVVPAVRTASEVNRLADSLVPLQGVQEVDRGQEWAQRIEAVVQAVEAAGLLLLPILLLGAAVLASSVVRLAVHERRREIEVVRLVGATDAFVRAPFLMEGTLAGLAGGLLAALGLWLVAERMGAQLAQALPLPPQLDPSVLASPGRLVLVVLGGAALGLVATALSVERQLK